MSCIAKGGDETIAGAACSDGGLRDVGAAEAMVATESKPRDEVDGPDGPDGPDGVRFLERRIRGMAADLAAATCEWLHLIEEFDRAEGWAGYGIKSCAHWLSWTCSLSPAAAREHVRVARALPGLPLIDAAFAAGTLSYSKVRAVVRVADRVDESVLLQQASVQTVSQLERTVRQVRRNDGDGLEQQRRREASWFFDDDGMLVLSARLPPDEGALLVAALEAVRTPPGVADACVGSVDGDVLPVEDPPAVSRADALVAIAERSLAAGEVDSSGDDRQVVVLHADAALLAGPGRVGMVDSPTSIDPQTATSPCSTPVASITTGPSGESGLLVGVAHCYVENGPGVDVATAQRIACDAAVVAVVHQVGEGEPLRLGRKTRAISPALRRALRIRDGGCVFPGCYRRRFLEAHHVLPWSFGGPTDLENLLLVCRFHHMLVHEAGYAVAAASPGNWEFRTRDGILISTVIPLGPAGGTSSDCSRIRADTAIGPDTPDMIRDDDRLLPGWAGEPFHLWETVAALLESPRPDDPCREDPWPDDLCQEDLHRDDPWAA